MVTIYLGLDLPRKEAQDLLLEHALSGGKENSTFVYLHPRWARLLDLIDEAQFGRVQFDLRDALPESPYRIPWDVKISRRVNLSFQDPGGD
jgi:hypothetical protein